MDKEKIVNDRKMIVVSENTGKMLTIMKLEHKYQNMDDLIKNALHYLDKVLNYRKPYNRKENRSNSRKEITSKGE